MLYLLILLIIFSPLNVKAKDLYLDTLEIKNGTLSLAYDKYNTQYTVEIAKDVYSLDIEYSKENDYVVTINNNHDLQNDSLVTISLSNNQDQVTYELHILKDEEETIEVFNEIPKDESNFMYTHKIYLIPLVIIILIFILFKIFFPKHKK